jgi:hypothetical protein
LKIQSYIVLIAVTFFLIACSGSKKYFKAAERLEQQGLVGDAAEYYLEALQRKPTNVDARIKLREVGQKHVSSMSSDFFRNYNTQQLEESIKVFEKLTAFTRKTSALNVPLDYPKTYEVDYQNAIETYCSKNYHQAHLMVNQKRFSDALTYIANVKKYKKEYKTIGELEIIATCEPLYQSAINSLETKNYAAALNLLSKISAKTDNYKDSRDLLELASAQQDRTFILFQPKPASVKAEKELQQLLYDNFNEAAQKSLTSIKIINNTPFQNAPGSTDLNNSTNIDLIQAIRKATGADYFYVFDISNKKEANSGLAKTPARGFQEIRKRINDSTVITEYKPFDYNVMKASRALTYDYKYKIINAYNNQIVASQTQPIRSADAVEYNQFRTHFTGDINTLFPYNPQQTVLAARLNARNWRSGFSARSELKSIGELKNEALNQNVRTFLSSAANMK